MNDWKKELRKRFSEASMPEPEGLWEGIEEELSGSRKKVFPFWWPLIGVAAAAVAAIVWLPGRPQSSRSIDPVAVVEKAAATSAPVPEESSPAVTPDEWIPSSIPANPHPAALPATVAAIQDSADKLDERVPSESDSPDKVPVPSESAETDHPKPEKTSPQAEKYPVFPFDHPEPAPTSVLHGLQLSARTSGSGYNSNSTTRYGFGTPDTRSYSSPAYSTGLPYAALANTENETTVSQRIPVRIGLTLSLQIGTRWSIESGILRSFRDIDTRITSNYMTTYESRRTRYWGIPLSLQYMITKPERPLSLYVSAGTIWEKADRERVVSSAQIGTYLQQKEQTDNHPDAFLWSAVGSLGLQYSPVRRWPVHIFAEPGLNWIVKEWKDGKFISSSEPVQFTFSAGLRFSIMP